MRLPHCQIEREELLKDFSEIYAVRSQIVHSGKSRLSASEWRQFNKLKLMCCRVLQEEVKLLSADLNGRNIDLGNRDGGP
jgi:hypothetical protein